MKRTIFSVLVMLFSLNSYAGHELKAFDVAIQLSLDGKVVASPHVIVKEGQSPIIFQKYGKEEMFIEVVALDNLPQSAEAVLMKFVVGKINKNGTSMVISKPQIIAKDNQPTTLTINEKGSQAISLNVLVKRASPLFVN